MPGLITSLSDRAEVIQVIGIIPPGLLFAYVYARWGRPWPLIFAHSLIDNMVLTGYLGS